MGVSQMPDDQKAVQEVEDLKRATKERELAQKADDPEEVKRIEDLKKDR